LKFNFRNPRDIKFRLFKTDMWHALLHFTVRVYRGVFCYHVRQMWHVTLVKPIRFKHWDCPDGKISSPLTITPNYTKKNRAREHSLDTILNFPIFLPKLRNEKKKYDGITRSDLNLQYIFIIVVK